jgi:hypothetical protein
MSRYIFIQIIRFQGKPQLLDTYSRLFTPTTKHHGQLRSPYIKKINHFPRTRQQTPAKHKIDIDYSGHKKTLTTPKYT